jgi:hypothetical protein
MNYDMKTGEATISEQEAASVGVNFAALSDHRLEVDRRVATLVIENPFLFMGRIITVSCDLAREVDRLTGQGDIGPGSSSRTQIEGLIARQVQIGRVVADLNNAVQADLQAFLNTALSQS